MNKSYAAYTGMVKKYVNREGHCKNTGSDKAEFCSRDHRRKWEKDQSIKYKFVSHCSDSGLYLIKLPCILPIHQKVTQTEKISWSPKDLFCFN